MPEIPCAAIDLSYIISLMLTLTHNAITMSSKRLETKVFFTPEEREQLDTEAARLLAEPARRLRAYVGHAGWSPGQLEDELRRGAWVVVPLAAEAETLAGEDLWRRWLTRHRPELGLVADAPGDLGLN